jgi:hypothetical protein
MQLFNETTGISVGPLVGWKDYHQSTMDRTLYCTKDQSTKDRTLYWVRCSRTSGIYRFSCICCCKVNLSVPVVKDHSDSHSHLEKQCTIFIICFTESTYKFYVAPPRRERPSSDKEIDCDRKEKENKNREGVNRHDQDPS